MTGHPARGNDRFEPQPGLCVAHALLTTAVDTCGRPWTPRCPSMLSGLFKQTAVDSCGSENPSEQTGPRPHGSPDRTSCVSLPSPLPDVRLGPSNVVLPNLPGRHQSEGPAATRSQFVGQLGPAHRLPGAGSQCGQACPGSVQHPGHPAPGSASRPHDPTPARPARAEQCVCQSCQLIDGS